MTNDCFSFYDRSRIYVCRLQSVNQLSTNKQIRIQKTNTVKRNHEVTLLIIKKKIIYNYIYYYCFNEVSI